MRLYKRGRVKVYYRGEMLLCALRPRAGEWRAMGHGSYVQDKLRLLLPWKTVMQPGERLLIEGRPYICRAIRCFPGHIQADAERCAG